jgi:hypothetical protein
MKELLLWVEAAKKIVFINALVEEMKRQGNHCLVENVLMGQAVAKGMIRGNMLQI